MNYEYIASKGLNLYSLYDTEHQYNNYYVFTNILKAVNHWLMIFTLALIIIFWILLPLWVFKDARKGHLNATKWTIVALLANAFGLGIYLILRPKRERCSSCNKEVEDDWIVCPYCEKKIKI